MQGAKTTAATITAFMIMLAGSAHATGSLDCAIGDDNVDFAVTAVFSYSGNPGLTQVEGELALKKGDPAPSLEFLAIEKTDLVQQWIDGRDLRLQFYRETADTAPAFGSVQLTITTASDEDGDLDFKGKYRLVISGTGREGGDDAARILEGNATCSAG